MADDLHHYSEILDLPDLPDLPARELQRVKLCEPWGDLSVAYLGGHGFCRVKYNGAEYRNRVYRRQPTQAGD